MSKESQMTNDECTATRIPVRSPFVLRPSSLTALLLTWLVRLYQLTLSPAQTYFLGANGGCRYTPSCSNYAMDALREHGAVAGSFLAAKRICRCHPWGGCGHDPVPPKTPKAPFSLNLEQESNFHG
jgi:putative membrane protein insertion efficiency factor